MALLRKKSKVYWLCSG